MLLKGRSRKECLEEMEELRHRIETLRPETLELTASIGVASNMLRTDAGYEEILDEADRAMYRAKDLGRNRVVMTGVTTRRTASVELR